MTAKAKSIRPTVTRPKKTRAAGITFSKSTEFLGIREGFCSDFELLSLALLVFEVFTLSVFSVTRELWLLFGEGQYNFWN